MCKSEGHDITLFSPTHSLAKFSSNGDNKQKIIYEQKKQALKVCWCHSHQNWKSKYVQRALQRSLSSCLNHFSSNSDDVKSNYNDNNDKNANKNS